jgi:hypothetical protein
MGPAAVRGKGNARASPGWALKSLVGASFLAESRDLENGTG